MAHITEKVGAYSEFIAKSALLAAGYDGVGSPDTREYYDITADCPITRRTLKFQVKTIKRREDKGGDWFVLFAKSGNSKPYGIDKASDYYVGVLVDNGETPRIFLVENVNPNQSEYWTKTYDANEKWTELPIGLDRMTLRVAAEGIIKSKIEGVAH